MILCSAVAANAYELNNLDNAALDAPMYGGVGTGVNGNGATSNQDGIDFQSLPCETFLVACRTEKDLINGVGDSFKHKNPIYQSAHVQLSATPSANSSNDPNGEVKKGGK